MGMVDPRPSGSSRPSAAPWWIAALLLLALRVAATLAEGGGAR